MITLFHGSYTTIDKPIATFGRKDLDFGLGFYVTKLRAQAEAWAKIVAGRKGPRAVPVLNIYELDLSNYPADKLRLKSFEQYDLEWLDFVVNCRDGGTDYVNYDIIEGGVANDNVIDTVEDYRNHIITAHQALGQLSYKKVNHQLCIVNQAVIDSCLRFINSIHL